MGLDRTRERAGRRWGRVFGLDFRVPGLVAMAGRCAHVDADRPFALGLDAFLAGLLTSG